MTVVYVDSVFFLNGLMDYLLLCCTARLAGVPLRRLRLLLAAALGGVYAVAVFLPGLGFLTALPVKLASGVAMLLMAFGGQRRLLRLALLFFAVSCAFAGCVLALSLLTSYTPLVNGVFYTDVNGKVLLLSTAAAYLILSVVFRHGARHGGGELLPVVLSFGGRQSSFTALRDSGNTLADPMTGQQVLVVWAGAVESLWTSELSALLTPAALRRPVETLEQLHALGETRFRLLSYRAVGVEDGLLLVFRSDWAQLGKTKRPAQLTALSPTEVSDGGGYAALWGGEEERGGKRLEKTAVETTGAAAALGTAPTGENYVHWRQRYPAAAAESGGGGGATGANRRGVGSTDPD